MSKNWYPVIDYGTCVECGICSNFCPHGVYDKTKSPTPIVVNPDNCIEHCHGCQKKCKVGAISYVGDNSTGSVKCSCNE
jgi:NAD-dependent dihydropyrimidine dehydrogenase PreA subunit